MYKIKPFTTYAVPLSNKYSFKTKCKISLKLLTKPPNYVKWDLWVSDLEVFNADFDMNLFGMHYFYYFSVGKFLHFGKEPGIYW